LLLENIFNHLFKSSDYWRIVFPHLKENYFIEEFQKILFKKIVEYNSKYNKQPTMYDMKLMISTDNDISERATSEINEFLDSVRNVENISNEELLIKETESWCQNRALENAIIESVEIIQNPKASKGAIEEKVKEALSVEFDVKIGMDFFKDAPARYKMYTEKEEYIPTDIDVLNTLLNGGFRRKSLHCFLGRVNIGKSVVLCHLAASSLKKGYNVLYISAEMSEEMISKRIDANLIDVAVNDINETLDRKIYLNKIKALCEKTQGKLIVKEYPTSSANANHVKNLLGEIQLKRGFTPDIVLLDYLNIFGSSRLGGAAMINSYQFVKAIAEEFRALAVTYNFALVTASQVNRSNANTNANDMDMTATSESWGLPAASDWMGAIIQSPELFEQRKYVFKNLKSRFNSNINQVVTLGVDYDKMRLINLAEEDQEIPIHIKDKIRMDQEKDEQNFNFS
jgi:replicative DNA helicase